MSKQISFMMLKGKLYGISFYERNGVPVARRAVGPDRNRIFNDPKFERTRQNINEFSALSKATSAFQHIFKTVNNVSSCQLRDRVSSIMRDIIKEHDFLRGKRSVLLSQHRERLLHFEASHVNNLEYVFSAEPVVAHSADRLTATISLDDIAKTQINAPKDATHLKFIQLVGVLSDIVYNETLKTYEVADASLNRLHSVTMSDYIPLIQTAPTPVNLQTTLEVEALTPTCTVVQAFGVIFFQKGKSLYYPSKEKTAMRIVDVF